MREEAKLKEEARLKKMTKEELFEELNKMNKELGNKNIGEERRKEIIEKLNLLEELNKK